MNEVQAKKKALRTSSANLERSLALGADVRRLRKQLREERNKTKRIKRVIEKRRRTNKRSASYLERLKIISPSLRIRRLRTEMEEISREQKMIKEGQRQVKEKLEAIERECEELREKTKMFMHTSSRLQTRLWYIFQIQKAEGNGDFILAARLTYALRGLIAREEKSERSSAD